MSAQCVSLDRRPWLECNRSQPQGIGVILTSALPGTHQSSGHYASSATPSCYRALQPQHASGVRPLSTLQFLLSPLSPNHSPQLARTCCCLHVHVLQHRTAHSCPSGSGSRESISRSIFLICGRRSRPVDVCSHSSNSGRRRNGHRPRTGSAAAHGKKG